ncbi:MAG TPA: hypothetical protein VMW73_11135, partial [Spirochaetia bacterium]|nr:hypothetical protein [Spirochaetia bacterium]
LSVYATLIGRHWRAPYNKDYPLIVPFKRMLGPLLDHVGSRITKRLMPPPPKEINHRRAAAQFPVPDSAQTTRGVADRIV